MTVHFLPTQMDDGNYAISKNGTMVGYAWVTQSGNNRVAYYMVTQGTTIPDTATFKLDLLTGAPSFNSSTDFKNWVAKQPKGSSYTDKISETSSYGTW